MYRFQSWSLSTGVVDLQTNGEAPVDECEADTAQTIGNEKFDFFLDLCFQEATAFSLQKGLWPSATDPSLERALEPERIKTIETKVWFLNDYRNAPIGSERTMCIHLYRASDAAKAVLQAQFREIFLGHATPDLQWNKYTLEDLCFFKGKELIVGTISHEFILQVYPPNGTFEQAILPLGAWERLGYPAPALLT